MKQEIINGGNARYLGELERFKDGIPFGIETIKEIIRTHSKQRG